MRCPVPHRLKSLAAPRVISCRTLPTDHAHPVPPLIAAAVGASATFGSVKPLFLTGASGFIGTELLQRLRSTDRPNITCLTRSPEALAARIPPLPSWRYLEGDLSNPSRWAEGLVPGSAVIHLAAATGKASAAELRATNVDGTRALLSLCTTRQAGRIIYLSSIAAKFSDRDHYPYAETKREAERIIRGGACPFLIIRPTMVFGEGSPVLRGLTRLAAGRIGLMPGDGRWRVQPVHVSDVAEALASLLDGRDPPLNDTVELGGPEPISMAELLERIRVVIRGRPGTFLRLPLRPMRELLAALERIVGNRLPLSAGQLASFANDGTAATHPWTLSLRSRFRSVEEMLADLEAA